MNFAAAPNQMAFQSACKSSAHCSEDNNAMALEHGVSTFISMGDDPVAMQRFADEVAQELRSGSLLSGDSATVEPMEITRLQPDGLVASPAFSHVAVVPAGATTIYLGGQNGVNADGKIVSDDVAEQSTRAIDNASTALEAAGASLADVVQWTVFMAEDADINAAYEAIGPRLAGPGAPPLVTMARVAALGVPGALVEVSAIAAVVPG
jgi:enamine deaminase RidA (YjgF/YER057c/UK114 family)